MKKKGVKFMTTNGTEILVQIKCCGGKGGTEKEPCLLRRCPLFDSARQQIGPNAGWVAIWDRVARNTKVEEK